MTCAAVINSPEQLMKNAVPMHRTLFFAIRYGDDRHNAFAQDGPDRSTYRGLGYDDVVTDSKKVLPRSFWAQNGATHFVL